MFGAYPQISKRLTNPANNHVSTADTVSQMNSIVSASFNSPTIVKACIDACQNLPYGCDDRTIAEALWYWIKKRIKFVTDETSMTAMGIPIMNPTKELLISPATLLAMPEPQGDCDDFSMLAKTMLYQCGMKASFITVKADKEDPRVWSHIYCKAYFSDGTSMMFDTSHGQWPGWETNRYWEKREWA